MSLSPQVIESLEKRESEMFETENAIQCQE